MKNNKKIIIQIYNDLQVLWSSKMKFVSLSQLLGWPLFGSKSGPLTAPGFTCGGGEEKKKKGRKDEGI